jgi:hypothetical protein
MTPTEKTFIYNKISLGRCMKLSLDPPRISSIAQHLLFTFSFKNTVKEYCNCVVHFPNWYMLLSRSWWTRSLVYMSMCLCDGQNTFSPKVYAWLCAIAGHSHKHNLVFCPVDLPFTKLKEQHNNYFVSSMHRPIIPQSVFTCYIVLLTEQHPHTISYMYLASLHLDSSSHI